MLIPSKRPVLDQELFVSKREEEDGGRRAERAGYLYLYGWTDWWLFMYITTCGREGGKEGEFSGARCESRDAGRHRVSVEERCVHSSREGMCISLYSICDFECLALLCADRSLPQNSLCAAYCGGTKVRWPSCWSKLIRGHDCVNILIEGLEE